MSSMTKNGKLQAAIWKRNAHLPEPISECVNNLISDRARAQPNALAVCSTKGRNITYYDLDTLSDKLAQCLSLIVSPGAIVPLCFEKSVWTPVAMLAVLKVQAAFVLLDVEQPEARLKSIIKQTKAEVIICSKAHIEMGSTLNLTNATKKPCTITKPDADIDAFILMSPSESRVASNVTRRSLSETYSTMACYVVFTSGTTGTPKGAVLTHTNICSALKYQLEHLEFKQDSRVFDFASYSFDVAVHNMLATLVGGGALCIPTSTERLQDPAGAMASMGVTLVNLTPSVAHLIDPSRIPTLKTIIFLGETLTQAEAERWANTGKNIRLINTYGPAECTPISTIESNPQFSPGQINVGIGLPFGCAAWLVDPEDHHSLVPHDKMGELLIEGPLVGFGYLNEPEKTQQSFVPSPRWLREMRPFSRLYKTGDLAMYNPDGSLCFMGRKDTQVKINGQRVELGEIEHHVLNFFPNAMQVIVDEVTSSSSQSLAAFIQLNAAADEPIAQNELKMNLIQPKQQLHSYLSSRLPRYMIPTSFILVASVPKTPSGKTDRKTLRQKGSDILSTGAATSHLSKKRQPTSNVERVIQSCWATVLSRPIERFGLEDAFLGAGGDSLAAIQLVGEARKNGIHIVIADVLNPETTLFGLAQLSTAVTEEELIPRFSLLKDRDSSQMEDISANCGISPNEIEDVYPCTPMQEGLIALTMQQAGDYILQIKVPLGHLNENLAKGAWEQMTKKTPIFRTRIVDTNLGLLQVVLKQEHSPIQWLPFENLQDYLIADKLDVMKLGKPLARFAITNDSGVYNNEKYMVITLHHALYDGWSLDLVMDQVDRFYRDGGNDKHQTDSSTPQFNSFVKYVERQRTDPASNEYWQKYLKDAQPSAFPHVQKPDNQSTRKVSIMEFDCQLTQETFQRSEATLSTIIRGALALLLSEHTLSHDVSFGATVSGRTAPTHNIEGIVGPTIATVPIRVHLEEPGRTTVSEFLRRLQVQATEMIPFEQTGLHNIGKLGDSARKVCEFQTLLVIQPQDEVQTYEMFWQMEIEQLNTYALTLECFPQRNGNIKIQARYDSAALESWELGNLLEQMGWIINKLMDSQSANVTLDVLDLMPMRHKEKIWEWNENVPSGVDKTIHDLFQEQVSHQNDSHLAVHAWDGKLTYRELDQITDQLATHFRLLGVNDGHLVPVCFEKTIFAVIAMLGILKSGAGFVPIEPSLPKDRRETILKEIKPPLVLSCGTCESLFQGLEIPTVSLDWDLLRSVSQDEQTMTPDPRAKLSSSSTAYVIFTSGSTGKPKGVVVPHSAASSSCTSHGKVLGFNNTSRVYQFSSYSFDACIAEIFTTLIFGGCVCIPSSEARLSQLSETIDSMGVNWMFLTPAVARLIEPSAVPSVRTIAIGGEKFSSADAERWLTDGRRVFLVYGPTECCVYCSGHDLEDGVDSRYIGLPVGCLAWIVFPDDHNRLTPLGAVGELLIEGPIVSGGYLNSQEKTQQSFISSPQWLRGVRPSSRLYKTGDLVQYAPKSRNDSGRLKIVGRKDTQVKLRGQRLELAEVEHYIRQSIPTAKQVITEVSNPGENKSSELLVAFVEMQTKSSILSHTSDQVSTASNSASAILMQLAPQEKQQIAGRLPPYMIPEFYFCISGSMPRMVSSGKTDRKQLRELGANLVTQYRMQGGIASREKRAPSNEVEKKLLDIWKRVLDVPVGEEIGVDEVWETLGGDSIASMHLVSEARKQGFSFTVADIRRTTIATQAQIQNNIALSSSVADEITPFTLLPSHVDVKLLLLDLGLSDSTEVEDIYPCTPLQEGIMALSGKHSGDYVLINVLELHEGLRLDSFKAAWEEAVRLTPALRTQIVTHPDLGLLQLVHKGKPDWIITEEYVLERYMEEAKLSPMGLGQPLSRFALLGPDDQPTYFVWTYHHSLYDGWSLPLITDLVAQIYQNNLSDQSLQPFKAFVKYAEQSKGATMDSYWKKYLEGNEASPFPSLPSQIREPMADMMQERGVSHFGPTPSDISISTLLRAALGVVLGSFSGSSDATFGATLSGRNASVPGIADIIGPTIATVPVRIKIPAKHDSETIVSWLKTVQQQATDMIPFEQAGLQHISRLSEDTQRACQFGTLLVIQTDSQGFTLSSTFGTWKPSDDQSGFATYALTLEYIPSAKKDQLTMFRARFDSRVINAWTVERLLGQWEYVTQQLVVVLAAEGSSGAFSLVDIDLLTSPDRDILQKWNISSPAPVPVERCIHVMISEQAHARKGCAAVDGWDGQLSYEQLEIVTSQLAEHLLNLGVGPEVFVPICYPKSTWTIVAMLGVLKAGAAFVLLDPLHPQSRLGMLCEKTRATIAIASAPSTVSKIEAFVETVIIVDGKIESPDWIPQIIKSTSTSPSASPPPSAAPSSSSSVELVSPKNTAYIIFTSGSTGVPKGCKIPHVGYCSTAVYHGSVQNMSTDTRSLQFGSYSFAGAIMEILMTLIYGGCVCVPSSNDLSRLSNEIRRLNANWAFLTSTVLSALHPDEVPSLKTICVGGEPIQASQITQWSNRVHLRQTYGSAETSAVVSSAHLTGNSTTGDVGRPTTGRYWIVNPQNVNKLAPLGSAGEVIIEGPTIGREYLDEPQKSAAAFITVPSWRTDVFGQVQQGSRFYKTGDLGSYTSDGSIILMGRKDTQVKLRGQRIELGEVEHQTRLASGLLKEAAVEIIVPKDSATKANAAILVAFFVLDENSQDEGSKSEVVASIRDRLYHILPQYMVPSAFLDLTEMPKTISKKTDRRRLREIAASYSREELFKLNMAPSGEGPKRQPSTKQEKILHDIWSHVLGLDKIKFGVEDDFFSLSGDSISALRMVAEARRSGIEISMTSIFVERDIVSLARVASYTTVVEDSGPISSFSLIPSTTDIDVDELRKRLAAPCGVDPNQIEDAYPCTPLQEGLLALTMQKPGDYVMQNVLQIAEDVNFEAFQNAWQLVLSSTPILRTRMVDHHSFGLLQVIINKPIEWEYSSIEQGLDYLLEDDKARPVDFGSSLARFTIAGAQENGQPRWLIWTVHHSIYDGWSMPLILEMVNDAYSLQKAPHRHDFVPFVKYLHDSDSNSSQEYWQSTMELYESDPFPSLPTPKHKPMANQVIERTAEIPASNGQPGITLPIIARAGLGILINRHTSTDDIVFGTILSGRNTPIPGIEDLVGPTIATVPIRVQFLAGQSVHDYVHALQQQFIQMIPFEQFGLQNISKSNRRACDIQTLLVVHSSDERVENADANVLGTWLTDADQSGFTTYALTLDCYLPSKNGDCIKVRATFDQNVIPEWEMGQFMDQYLFVLQQLIVAGPECTVSDIDLMTPVNRALVWQRNATASDTIERCVHDLIRERTEIQPLSIALTSLEGDMSYEELDVLSSQLAHELVKQDGYYTGALVPLCFEKSIWTVVAMLASMKSGLTAVTFDTTQPVERIKKIVQQMGDPPFIISSVLRNSMASELLPDRPLVEVGPKLKHFNLEKHEQLPTVAPSALLCVVFTSGSTGVPKGVAWRHKNMASGIQYQSKAFGHGPGARIFAFASYSFDISWHDTLSALCSGSTLCIPSEIQRKDDLESSIASFSATVAFLTPSVARLLRPEAIPSLRLLALGGEPQRWADFRDWPDHVTKLSVYGPAECTVVSGAEDARAVLEPRDFTLPSHGNLGLNLWLVDPLNPNLLVPPGITGEIWLEGPLVGAGYIGDEKKTAASFTQDPSWLLQGDGLNFQGRRGRLYKTGDTARYSSDGRLWFMGRKDTQVKIRGQRVELSEVEYHVRQAMGNGSEGPRQVVAEIISLTTEDGRSNPMLVVFIENWVNEDSGSDTGKPEQKDLQVNLTSIKPEITDELLRHIPSYMVPRVYFSTSFTPKTINGKTDRKLLRQIGSGFCIHQLAQLDSVSAKRQPISAAELSLQHLWAQVLKLSLERVGCDDNFFQLGGDSIAAMRLSALARAQDSSLTVAAIFNTPLLSDQAKIHFQDRRGNFSSASEQPTAPFALLPSSTDIASLCKDLTSTFGISGIVEDIYPCTSLQEGLLALTSKTAGNYVMQSVLELPDSPSFSLSAFKAAWDAVVHSFDILRTRVVEHEDVGLVQVVLKQDNIPWIHHPNVTLQSYCSRDKLAPMDLGKPLVRFGLIGTHEMTDNPRWFVWTAHHALYDGWSLPIVTKQAASNYRHILDGYPPQASEAKFKFNEFVRYSEEQKADPSVDDYWRKALACKGTEEAVPFPPLPGSIQQPNFYHTAEKFCPVSLDNKSSVTTSTFVRAALALLLSHQTGVSEALFGATVSGRNAPIPGIEQIVGPTIATVPVKISTPKESSIGDYLMSVQRQATEMIRYEQTGLQRISKVSQEALHLQTLLVVQSPGEPSVDKESDHDYGIWRTDGSQLGFTTYGLTIECYPIEDNTGFRFCATFDEKIIEPWRMERILVQLSFLAQQLARLSDDTLLAEIDPLPQEDHDLIWRWNATVPETVNRCVHDMIYETATQHPDAQAVHAWDGNFTYAQLDSMANSLGSLLLTKGVTPGSIVPLCFEKSKWTVVGVLGVLKAGAAFVFLDAETQPEARLRAIHEQSKASVICSSIQHEELVRGFGADVIVVGPESLTQATATLLLPNVHPSSPLYLNFTSGSTGNPKGAIISHRSFASALTYQLRPLNISQATRLYDFASYSFDVAIHNVLSTLAAGGCLCVPSNLDRKARLAESMEEMHANYVDLTASVSRLIDPLEVPTLRTLTLGGEPVTQDDAERWWGKVKLINSCGPSECTPMSVINSTPGNPTGLRRIGLGTGMVTWVVDPKDHHRLLPVGQVGELILEGPLLGSGYLEDPSRTEAVFIEAPRWLSDHRSHPTHVYKTGDLVQYHIDGSIHIVSRKDNQVKVRGQRVELEEVEHHLRRHVPQELSVVAEAVAMNPSAALVAFVSQSSQTTTATPQLDAEQITTIATLARTVTKNMSTLLPPYMVPSLYIPVMAMPMTTTGKTNRKELRNLASSLPREKLDLMRGLSVSDVPRKAPTTAIEITFRDMWARMLNLPAESVGVDNEFQTLGGDSILAMRIVAEARKKQGLHLSVADIFRERTISNILKNNSFVKGFSTQISTSIQPYALVGETIKRGILSTAPFHQIEDILPVTDFQTQNIPHPCNYFYLDLDALTINEERLRRSCQSVVDHYPLLRSTFVPFNNGYWQVVMHQSAISYNVISSDRPLDEACDEFCKSDMDQKSPSENPLTKFVLVYGRDSNSKATISRLIICLSHAQYDGFSLPVIVRNLADLYDSCIDAASLGSPDASFASYLAQLTGNRQQCLSYWREYLAGSKNTHITSALSLHPGLAPSSDAGPFHKVQAEGLIAVPTQEKRSPFSIPQSTILASAWAILLSILTGREDVIFGHLVANREGSRADVIGPVVTIAPVRVKVQAPSKENPGTSGIRKMPHSIQNHLLSIQAIGIGSGWEDVLRSCTDWCGDKAATPGDKLSMSLQSLVQHQNIDENPDIEISGVRSKLHWYENLRSVPPVPLGIVSYPVNDGSGLRIRVMGSSQFMTNEAARRLVECLAEIVTLLFGPNLDEKAEFAAWESLYASMKA